MLFRSNNPTGTGKSAKGKATAHETPFEARRRELAEQEANLKAATARHESFIKKAPKIAEEIQKKQRENFLHNASRIDRGGGRGGVTLPDNRYLNGEATIAPRSRRRDRQQGKWLFFLLVAGLFIALWMFWEAMWRPAL